ncbi:hypothetical protein QYZ87_05095 [Porphyromonadaceae bacterium W3.11]|nr:hypothetical protein [Porphyromonadaceae bacterium W3.11]
MGKKGGKLACGLAFRFCCVCGRGVVEWWSFGRILSTDYWRFEGWSEDARAVIFALGGAVGGAVGGALLIVKSKRNGIVGGAVGGAVEHTNWVSRIWTNAPF